MGETNPGRNMWVAVGIQTSLTNVATVFTYFQPTEISGFLEEYATIESNRRLGTRFSGLGYLGTKQVPFGFTVEANADDIGRLLYAILGSDSMVTTATAVYTHTFVPQTELPYISVYGYLAGVADTSANDMQQRIKAAKITKATLKGGIDDVMTLAVEGMGILASAMSAVTPSFTTEIPWFLNSAQGTGTLSIGTSLTSLTKFDEARTYEIVIDNGMTVDHRIHGSATPVAISEGDSSVTGRFNAVYNPTTFVEINQFSAGTARALLMTALLPAVMAGTAHAKTLIVALNSIRYTGDTPSWDPDVMTVDMPFKAEISVSTYISVKNDKSLPYSSAV